MGPAWVTIREAVATCTLRPSDKGLADVAPSRAPSTLRRLPAGELFASRGS